MNGEGALLSCPRRRSGTIQLLIDQPVQSGYLEREMHEAAPGVETRLDGDAGIFQCDIVVLECRRYTQTE